MSKGIIKNYFISLLILVMCLVPVSCQSINRQALSNQKISQGTQSSEDKESNIIDGNNKILKAGEVNELIKSELENLVATTSNNIKSEEVNPTTSNEKENENAQVEVGQAVASNKKDNTDNSNQINKGNEEIKVNENNQGDRDNVINENNSVNRTIGIINDLFISNNKIYITVDSIEFFRGKEAYTEARKDGKLYVDENGKEFLPDGYYIRNNSSELKTYEVSSAALFNLCVYLVNPDTTQNSAETVGVKYSDFEKYINNTKTLDGRSRMFWISLDNGIVNKLEMQYTP